MEVDVRGFNATDSQRYRFLAQAIVILTRYLKTQKAGRWTDRDYDLLVAYVSEITYLNSHCRKKTK